MTNIMSLPPLSDDEVSVILSWVFDQNDRKSFSQVCKQWFRVEAQARTSIRVLEPESFPIFLPRFKNLISIESSTRISDTNLNFIAQSCPNLQILNLNVKRTRGSDDEFDDGLGVEDFGDDGLVSVANGCVQLSKVMLRRRKNVGVVGVVSIVVKARSFLTNLDLGNCNLVNDEVLKAISECILIKVLNFQGCTLITDKGLAALSSGSCAKTLKKLVLAECDRITDSGVSLLQKMCCLEEQNLSECGPKVTDFGYMAIASLKRLNLAWLINVSDFILIAIAEKCRGLERIDLTGCELITGLGVRAFANHECLSALVLASCYNISRDDLDMLFRCKSLTHLVLDRGLRMWIPMDMQEHISKHCALHWK